MWRAAKRLGAAQIILMGRQPDHLEPGRVFDFAGDLDKVPDGYRAMDERKAVKVLLEF